jgi:hypothetical protein
MRALRALRAERVGSVRSVCALRVCVCLRAKPNLSGVLNRIEFEIEFQFPVPNPFFRNKEGRKPVQNLKEI